MQTQVEALRRHLLPNPFDKLGSYADSDKVQTHTRAFVVLCHAELEGYFEAWTKDLLRKAEQLWTKNRRISPLVPYLIVFRSGIKPPQALANASQDAPSLLSAEISSGFNDLYKAIKDNHGIKEKNLLPLLTPLGIPGSALTSSLIADLDSFGSRRGEHAHSRTASVTSVLDPEIEFDRVCRLIDDLKPFDAWAGSLWARLR